MKAHFSERWTVVGKAVGAGVGSGEFCAFNAEKSAFDGLKNTGRVGAGGTMHQVAITTLDFEWSLLGCPSVAVIKIDVEGAELGVLRGGEACIAAAKPTILLEWNERNLAAHGCLPDALLEWSRCSKYSIHALPYGTTIDTVPLLRAMMVKTEDFLLVPRDN
jgi:FkbM family methyltransferase